VDYVAHRSDLNYVIGEMISELNVGHLYIDGGDWALPARAPVGLLGARLELDRSSRRYRIAKILKGHNEEPRYRSPLTEIGVDVKEGDWLLAVDGDELSPDEDPYRLFVNRAANPILLTVAPKDDPKAKRDVKVNPIRDESSLNYIAWTERNREYVARQTEGAVGYMHIPNMGGDGAREFVKWFYPQARMSGLIVDDRANGGGNISQWIIERLRRIPLGYRYARTAEDARTYPDVVMRGPMACLISESSASDGDIFPYMFRQAGLGPLIGKRHLGRRRGHQRVGAADRRRPRLGAAVLDAVERRPLRDGGRRCLAGHRSRQRPRRRDRRPRCAARPRHRGSEKQLAKDKREFPPHPADPVKIKSALP
jgi:tricorn protease